MLGSNIKEDENLILLLAAIIGLFWGAFVDLQKSAEANIPYQTNLSSLIHQNVENKVHIKL